jgi:hypothetical protein
LTKVKIGKQLSTKVLQNLQIGRIGTQIIYHPKLITLLKDHSP